MRSLVIEKLQSLYQQGKYKLGHIKVHRDGSIYLGMGEGADPLRISTNTDDTGWIEITSASLLNGWEEYDEPVAYRKDLAGNVHLKGTVRYGALNYAVLQLPAAYRPSRSIRKVVPMRDGMGLIDINVDGYVIPRGEEEEEYDENGNPTGGIIEVGYLSLEIRYMP